MRETLKSKIENLQDILRDNLEDLNWGGCVDFAYYFSKALDRIKIDHNIVFLGLHDYPSDITEWDSASHIMVNVRGIGYIDGHETISSIKEIKKTYPRVLKFNNKKPPLDFNSFRRNGVWNTVYDKKRNTYLKRVINKHII